jgi:ATP-dependent DNA helicase RecQ
MGLGSAVVEVDPEWRAAREVALRRDGRRCAECGEAEPSQLDVHHCVPRANGGSNDPGNLLTLCDGCHAARHPNLQVSLSRRMMERWALRLARLLDIRRALPDEIEALSDGLRLFGKERLREGQLEAVLAALRGQDVLVVRPTGSGKTLCFQLPAVMRGGTTFVLSPLKALMKEQVVELQQRKIPGSFINSDLGPDEKRARYELLSAGALKFLYCTPERFGDKVRSEEVAALRELRPAFLVVDEAHCVVRWGDAFRPDYSKIAAIREALGNPPVLAFTATAGVRLQGEIKESLGMPEARTLVTGADRPNIALLRHHLLPFDPRKDEVGKARVQMQARAEFVARLLKNSGGKSMVFVPTVRIGEGLQAALRAEGLDLPFYHSRFATANKRDLIVGQFTGRIEPELDAVICTNAFGMGLDIPNVRLVINWQHPASVEDYLQEFGRAGRDGQPSTAVLLTNGQRDARLLEWMAEQSLKQALADGKISEQQFNESLERRAGAIGVMNKIAGRTDMCFRQLLLNELVGTTAGRSHRPLSERLLSWVFGAKHRAGKSAFCCDTCHPDRARNLIGHSPRIRPLGRIP